MDKCIYDQMTESNQIPTDQRESYDFYINTEDSTHGSRLLQTLVSGALKCQETHVESQQINLSKAKLSDNLANYSEFIYNYTGIKVKNNNNKKVSNMLDLRIDLNHQFLKECMNFNLQSINLWSYSDKQNFTSFLQFDYYYLAFGG